MQLRQEALDAHLARGLAPAYTLHGDEPLLLQEAGDAIRAAARAAGFDERQVFNVGGAHFDWSGVLGAAQAMSLFAQRQLIELRIPSGKPGKDGGEALQRLAAGLSPDVLLVVVLPRLDRQQQQSAWFSALESAGATLAMQPVERRALPQWLAQRLARQQQRVEDGEAGQQTLAFFADRVEGNLLAAHQELQKLALLHPPGVLDFDAVQSAVLNVARYTITQLSEAALGGQPGRLLRVLDGLRAEGEAAVLVHWQLAEDIRALRRVKRALADGRPLPMALADARVWGARQRLVERVVAQVDEQRLTPLLRAASLCDGVIKGLKHPDWPHDAWDALRCLALALAECTLAAAGGGGGRRRSTARLALRAG